MRTGPCRGAGPARNLVMASLACAILSPLQPALAAESPVPDGLLTLRRTETYKAAIFAGAKRSGAWVVSPCAAAKAALSDRLAVGARPGFDAQGRASSGAWIEHVTFEGCGEKRLLNVLVVAKEAGQLATVPLLPGTSLANPMLQRDGAAYAFVAAGVARDGCKPIYIADTAFLSFATEPAEIPGKPAWSERWTVAQCDRRIPVVLHFVPEQHGTAIVVDHLGHAP